VRAEDDRISSVVEHLPLGGLHAACTGEVNCEVHQAVEEAHVDFGHTFPRDNCEVALQQVMVAKHHKSDELADKGYMAAVDD